MFIRQTSLDGKISYWTIRPEVNRCITLDQVRKVTPCVQPPTQVGVVLHVEPQTVLVFTFILMGLLCPPDGSGPSHRPCPSPDAFTVPAGKTRPSPARSGRIKRDWGGKVDFFCIIWLIEAISPAAAGGLRRRKIFVWREDTTRAAGTPKTNRGWFPVRPLRGTKHKRLNMSPDVLIPSRGG